MLITTIFPVLQCKDEEDWCEDVKDLNCDITTNHTGNPVPIKDYCKKKCNSCNNVFIW